MELVGQVELMGYQVGQVVEVDQVQKAEEVYLLGQVVEVFREELVVGFYQVRLAGEADLVKQVVQVVGFILKEQVAEAILEEQVVGDYLAMKLTQVVHLTRSHLLLPST